MLNLLLDSAPIPTSIFSCSPVWIIEDYAVFVPMFIAGIIALGSVISVFVILSIIKNYKKRKKLEKKNKEKGDN